jgi:dolichol-phosphate mannosyltransferase
MAAMRSLSDIHLAIACPMANEGEEGARFVAEVLAECVAVGKTTFFAVLDNMTRDNTRELLEDYAKRDPRLVVVWAPENRCVVDAYMGGYRNALASGADWILEIDAGFSHQPAEIGQFFPLMLAGYDCVFGSRFIRGGGIHNSSTKRRLVSWGGTLLTNALIGTKLKDMTSGFEMFTREALEMVLEKGIHSRAHFFQTEIKIHCRNLKITEVPINYEMASPGLSSAPVNEAFQQLWRLFKLRLAGKLDEPAQKRTCITTSAS